MQIYGVKHEQRMWREDPDRVDVPGRNIMPRQHHDIELIAARSEEDRDRTHVRMEFDFDTQLLQRRHIRLPIFQIVRSEGNLATEVPPEFR